MRGTYMKKRLSILATAFALSAPALALDVRSTKVTLKPTRLEKDGSGFLLEVSASFDDLTPPEQKKKLGAGLAQFLGEGSKSFDRQDLDAQFDKEALIFKLRIEPAAILASSQKSFSACVGQWFNAQSNENRAKFNKAYLTAEDPDNSRFVRTSLADYFTAHLPECNKLTTSIPTEDIQYFTNIYIENKLKNRAQTAAAQNLASIYDQSFNLFQIESDKNLRADLLAKTAAYFDSFANLGLSQTASLDRLAGELGSRKPLTAAKLFALTLGGFLDSATLAEAFGALEEGLPTPASFDRSLFWINQIHGQCLQEYLADPSGKNCAEKLAAKELYWIEFSRSSGQFKLLIVP